MRTKLFHTSSSTEHINYRSLVSNKRVFLTSGMSYFMLDVTTHDCERSTVWSAGGANVRKIMNVHWASISRKKWNNWNFHKLKAHNSCKWYVVSCVTRGIRLVFSQKTLKYSKTHFFLNFLTFLVDFLQNNVKIIVSYFVQHGAYLFPLTGIQRNSISNGWSVLFHVRGWFLRL